MSPGGGGFGLAQVPLSEPAGTRHRSPVQQSPLVVHSPPEGAHMDAQCSAPAESGTQGKPPQQSPANEQLPPAATHATPASFVWVRLQRGMPVLSGWQQVLLEMQAQQSLRTLVVPPWQTAVLVKWQMSPAGPHAFLQVAGPPGQVLSGAEQVPIFVG
jgi:hypothetical protein